MTTFERDEDWGISEPVAEDDYATTLFVGDQGTLPLVARKALVMLLKRTHVWGGRHPQLWQAAVDYQDQIGSRLNDVFLELVLDERNQVAYKRQAGRDVGRSFSTLLNNSAYSRDEVGLLIRLREAHQRASRDGDDVAYLDRGELVDYLAMYRPDDLKDHLAADKSARNAIDRLVKDGFLLDDATDPDRLRVSPVVETLLTVERLPAFLEALWTPDATESPDAALEQTPTQETFDDLA